MQNAELESKLTRLRGGTKLVSKADKDRVEKQYERVRQEWRKRKRLVRQGVGKKFLYLKNLTCLLGQCMDVIKQVGEGAGKKDKEIMVLQDSFQTAATLTSGYNSIGGGRIGGR